jgi:hypothetical protein
VIGLLFVVSLCLGLVLRSGVGYHINAYFSNTVAMAVLLGIFFDKARELAQPSSARELLCKAGIPLVLFLWLLIPMQCSEILGPRQNWREVQEARARFTAQVDFLRAQPGPALCESLLRCYEAGKPYIYDPFNSTSLIHAGRLDANIIVERIRKQEYGAIQFKNPPSKDGQPARSTERFTEEILNSTAERYRVALVDKDCTIYVPKNSTKR